VLKVGPHFCLGVILFTGELIDSSCGGDQKLARGFLDKWRNADAKRDKFIDNTKLMVEKLFPAVTAAKVTAKAKKQTAVAAKAAARAAPPPKTKAEWQSSIKCQWKDAVTADAPPSSKVVVNEERGFFKISVLGCGPRHFSWTTRGGEQAAKCCLKWLWGNYIKVVKCELPAHLDFDDVVL
jgi:hypothetical protein